MCCSFRKIVLLCLFTIISIFGFPAIAVSATEFGTRDTARVAAQVVTGIGFIGGGTVLRHGATVFGLTTAATLTLKMIQRVIKESRFKRYDYLGSR